MTPERYQRHKKLTAEKGLAKINDHVFAAEINNIDSALAMLANQPAAVLALTGLKQEAEGKSRAL